MYKSNQFPIAERAIMIKTFARFPSHCADKSCRCSIKLGDIIYFDRENKKAYCHYCGEDILNNIT